MPRKHLSSHPWIDFLTHSDKYAAKTWLLLGEASSKIEHLSRAALRPDIAQKLLQITLIKGIQATTAIEGNTLSEREIQDHLSGLKPVPPSREYLGQEVANVRDALNQAMREALATPQTRLTTEEVCQFNEMVLRNLDHEDHVEPGHFRLAAVGVSDYLGAPAEDVEFLTDRLCHWINEMDTPSGGHQYSFALIRAILAHLYIAWIHPFGDGNGRTARLVEWKILVASGVPQPAAHLLSNFYNKTRTQYYRELAKASKIGHPASFVHYAVAGFVDEIRAQLEEVWEQHYDLTWRAVLHDAYPEEDGKVANRKRHLLIDLADHGIIDESRAISPKQLGRIGLLRFGADYGRLSNQTLSNDLADMLTEGFLANTHDGRVYAQRSKVLAFLPARVDPQLDV